MIIPYSSLWSLQGHDSLCVQLFLHFQFYDHKNRNLIHAVSKIVVCFFGGVVGFFLDVGLTLG